MKKIYKLTVCMLIFLLGLTACGSGGSDREQNQNISESRYDVGMELIAKLSEISKDESYEHIILSATDEAVLKIIDNIRNMDYSQPEHIYRVKNLDEVFSAVMFMGQSGGEIYSDISDTVKSVLETKFADGLRNIITAHRTSVAAMAVSGTYVVDTTFVDTSINACEAYIYTFKDAYPVMVSYVPGKDGAVAATAGYIIVDDYIGIDAEALSNDTSLVMLNIKLEEVEKK